MPRLRSMLVFLTALLAAGHAGAERLGDWYVDRNRDLVVAVTQNESESVLGYACARGGGGRCVFYFMPDRLRCNEGGRYALLVNGGRESSARSTVCTRLDWRDGQQYANVLDNSEALRNQLVNADGGTIGIARGTGADGFSISKFSMRGFREAFERVNRRRDRDDDRDDRDGRGPRDYPDRGNRGPDFVIYEHGNFQGRTIEGRADIGNFADVQFNDIVSSVIIHRGNWQFCTDSYYRGRCTVLGPGRYGQVGENDQYSSVRRVN